MAKKTYSKIIATFFLINMMREMSKIMNILNNIQIVTTKRVY